MTLGLAITTADYCCIVSERKLSGRRRTMRIPDSTKCGTVYFSDARLVYTFAGLASAAQYDFVTRSWLAEAMCKAGEGGAGARIALTKLAESLTEKFAEFLALSEAERLLSVLLVGFVGDHPMPTAFMISNYETLRADADPLTNATFGLSEESTPAGAAGVFAIGSGAGGLSASDLSGITTAIDSGSPQAVQFRAVQAIRAVSERESGTTVGAKCQSIILSSDADHGIFLDFSTDEAVTEVPVGAFVEARYGRNGAFLVFDAHYGGYGLEQRTIVAVPRVPKNQKCPCRSGRKFKSCHGRARAAPNLLQSRGTFSFVMVSPPTEGNAHIMRLYESGELALPRWNPTDGN